MKKILIIVGIIVIMIVSMIVVKYSYNTFYIASIPEVTDVILNDKNVKIKYKLNGNSLRSKIYYIFKNNNIIPEINDKDWKLSNNNEISFDLDKNIYYAYLKNEDNSIYKIYTLISK